MIHIKRSLLFSPPPSGKSGQRGFEAFNVEVQDMHLSHNKIAIFCLFFFAIIYIFISRRNKIAGQLFLLTYCLARALLDTHTHIYIFSRRNKIAGNLFLLTYCVARALLDTETYIYIYMHYKDKDRTSSQASSCLMLRKKIKMGFLGSVTIRPSFFLFSL